MPTYQPRRCALPTCLAQFTPTRAYQRYCCHRHAKTAHATFSREEVRQRRLTKAQRHPKARFVYEMLSEAEAGMCPWGCERRLPPGRTVTCGHVECERAYQNAYRLGRREVERPKLTVSCACGCGTRFETRDARHKYAPGHRDVVVLAQRAEARRRKAKLTGRPPKGCAIAFGKSTEPKALRPYPRRP